MAAIALSKVSFATISSCSSSRSRRKYGTSFPLSSQNFYNRFQLSSLKHRFSFSTVSRSIERWAPITCLSTPSTKGNAVSSTRLYVSGLSFRTTEESLRNAFQNFGQLVEVNLVMDRIANGPRGFAFLRYATEEESKKAIEGMHGKFLDGRVIFVEVAKPRSELRKPAPKHNIETRFNWRTHL